MGMELGIEIAGSVMAKGRADRLLIAGKAKRLRAFVHSSARLPVGRIVFGVMSVALVVAHALRRRGDAADRRLPPRRSAGRWILRFAPAHTGEIHACRARNKVRTTSFATVSAYGGDCHC